MKTPNTTDLIVAAQLGTSLPILGGVLAGMISWLLLPLVGPYWIRDFSIWLFDEPSDSKYGPGYYLFANNPISSLHIRWLNWSCSVPLAKNKRGSFPCLHTVYYGCVCLQSGRDKTHCRAGPRSVAGVLYSRPASIHAGRGPASMLVKGTRTVFKRSWPIRDNCPRPLLRHGRRRVPLNRQDADLDGVESWFDLSLLGSL